MFKRLISNAIVHWLIDEGPPDEFPLCDFERLRYEIRPCDVLLVEGRSRISDVIKAITQTAWSHAALYIGRVHDIEDPELRQRVQEKCQLTGTPETQLVIEGLLGKGIIVTPLTHYKDDHLRICRPKGLTPHDAQRVMGYAIKQVGYDYSVRHILDLARFMLPWSIIPRRWRSMIFEQNRTKMTENICSTMLAEAFSYVDFPILPLVKRHNDGYEMIHRNPKLVTPGDFDYSPYFEIVKYPFIETSDQKPLYRQLPWNRNGVVSNGEEVMSAFIEQHAREELSTEESMLKSEAEQRSGSSPPQATEDTPKT